MTATATDLPRLLSSHPFMTTREKLQDRGINLNTILLICGILSGVITAMRLGGPILNMPERSDKIESQIQHVTADVAKIQTTQAIQAESLKTLATISQANDRLAAELSEVRRRLDRLEGR